MCPNSHSGKNVTGETSFRLLKNNDKQAMMKGCWYKFSQW